MKYSKTDFPLMLNGDPVSELKVMQSGAGYYIGRTYFDTEDNFEGPYSRESDYMTKSDALDALKYQTFSIRDCIENNDSYDKGILPDLRKIRQDLIDSDQALFDALCNPIEQERD